MTRLEFFKQHGTDGVDLGLIGVGKLQSYIRYSHFMNLLAEGVSQADAIKRTADECCCCKARVYKSIYFFSKKGKN